MCVNNLFHLSDCPAAKQGVEYKYKVGGKLVEILKLNSTDQDCPEEGTDRRTAEHVEGRTEERMGGRTREGSSGRIEEHMEGRTGKLMEGRREGQKRGGNGEMRDKENSFGDGRRSRERVSTVHYGTKPGHFETSKKSLSHERGSERSEQASK